MQLIGEVQCGETANERAEKKDVCMKIKFEFIAKFSYNRIGQIDVRIRVGCENNAIECNDALHERCASDKYAPVCYVDHPKTAPHALPRCVKHTQEHFKVTCKPSAQRTRPPQ